MGVCPVSTNGVDKSSRKVGFFLGVYVVMPPSPVSPLHSPFHMHTTPFLISSFFLEAKRLYVLLLLLLTYRQALLELIKNEPSLYEPVLTKKALKICSTNLSKFL
ncbi:hypothetical protein KP509_08G000400 [Ceratopteris richardii]|uniref:Uncharacterized protein n=1 Tax=Ceratopteris richardii TaxID=49495 RepID=A0A8T2U2W4_CERRI|nr:hypothetical protein KP509_08G000400 [Ceratopteris richardii]